MTKKINNVLLQFVFVSSLCLFAADGGFISSRGVETGPSNTAVLGGYNVVLACRTDGVPTTNIRWYEYITSPTGGMISDGELILSSHPNSARYAIVHPNSSLTYDLQIKSTELTDGGVYFCKDSNVVPPAIAQLGADLVVLESLPVCDSTLPANGYVIEGEYYTMECFINFQASAGIAPLMTWTGPPPFNVAYSATNTTVWSGVGFTVNRTMEGQNFLCKTNFTSQGFGGANKDFNAPSWSNTQPSNQLFVHWAPTSMYATPILGSYEIGMEVTCFADAFPSPSYMWQNMETGQQYYDRSFTTTQAMVGYQLMRCQATNVMLNQTYTGDLYVDVYVNPTTTTPIPTTVLSTTPIPAVAPCGDLTGRWESFNPTAALCLTVDHANDARLIGLYRNASDTYWLQVTGRTREGKYDELGWAIIWPSTSIGVSAYAGECHSCYGNETLLANAISRTTKDSEFCGSGGTVFSSPQYTFKRVPPSYPCSSSLDTMLENMESEAPLWV